MAVECERAEHPEEDRADNVVEFLVKNGVPDTAISAQGFGEQRPVASNDTPQGRAQNRRVEIIIKSATLQ
jgi:chemotaxis protein MotB